MFALLKGGGGTHNRCYTIKFPFLLLLLFMVVFLLWFFLPIVVVVLNSTRSVTKSTA